MLDIKLLREEPEKVKKACQLKGINPKVVDDFLEKDEKWRQLITKAQELRQEHNEVSNKTKKEYTKETVSLALKVIGSQDKKDKYDVAVVKEAIKQLKSQSDLSGEEVRNFLYQIPNLPADDVPEGKDEAENVEVKKWGEPKKFDFKPKNHLELGEDLDLIDVKRAAKVSGTRFGYLKNEAVLLEFALVQFALKTLLREGFRLVVPPTLINLDITQALGYWQAGGNEDYYLVHEPKKAEGQSDFYLVGTAEHSLVPMHEDEIFKAKDLPRRYVGFSTCFRREAGSYGKDTRGIFRVHQFDKVEMVSFIKPQKDADKEENEYLLSLEEKLVQALDIPYQVSKMCTGDLGFPAARKYDLNCWFPSEQRYRETHSVSTCTDFQARRLKIRYRDSQENRFVHILNGTAFAIGRMILAILENYQQKDGSVLIPSILQSYVGKEKISPKS